MSGVLDTLYKNSRQAIRDGIYDNIPRQQRRRASMVQAIRECPGTPIISEIKFASPSMGTIRGMEEPANIAMQMVKGGATAISVLTQPYLFDGSPSYFADVREVVDIPMLMKDIIIDYTQLEAAARLGADCVLLIQTLFASAYDIDGFVDFAHRAGMEVLVEVHDKAELEKALLTKSDIIGVNNRNLDTLETSLETTKQVLAGYDDRRPIISESGINTPKDIAYLKECGAQAFLVGTSIMKHGNVKEGVSRLVYS